MTSSSNNPLRVPFSDERRRDAQEARGEAEGRRHRPQVVDRTARGRSYVPRGETVSQRRSAKVFQRPQALQMNIDFSENCSVEQTIDRLLQYTSSFAFNAFRRFTLRLKGFALI